MDYFSRDEVQCQCGCGYNTVDYELAQELDSIREYFGSPITINSGCRCREYNAKEGGSTNSQHLYGKAVDMVVKGVNANEVYKYLDQVYKGKYGIGKYNGRTHFDVRSGSAARWDAT